MTEALGMPTPSVESGVLPPMLIVLGVAVVGVLVEAFLPGQQRYAAQLVLSLGGLVAAFVAVVALAQDLHGSAGRTAVLGAVAVDAPALFLQATILLVGVLGILLVAERRIHAPADDEPGPGLDAFPPQASAVAGSVVEKLATKAGVMQTEVFPLTLFAIGGMLLFPAADDLLTMFIALEVLSLPLYLLCGLARRRRLLSQEASVKYFLLGAFSSAFFLYRVAMLDGYAGTLDSGGSAKNEAGVSSTLFYLFAYGFSTVGAFAVVGLVRNPEGEEDTALVRWAGLGRRYPVVGIVFSLFLLAFAGIPLTSGFVSKFAVFKAAGEGGAMPLVVIGVIASAIAAYFYVRVIVLMFFTEPPDDAPAVVVPSVLTTAVVTITAAVTFVLCALPQPLLDLANTANHFLP